MQYEEILEKLKSLADPEAVVGMARYGINQTGPGFEQKGDRNGQGNSGY